MIGTGFLAIDRYQETLIIACVSIMRLGIVGLQ